MKKILILGYGKTGKAIEKFFVNNKIGEVLIYDEKDLGLKNQIYDIDEDIAKSVKEVFCSPAFRTVFNKHEIIKKIQKFGLPIFSDIDLFLSFLPKGKKVIGVTGTNGKSTTTALITHILNANNKKAIACGNIGLAVFDVDVNLYDYFVIEISSAQLEISKSLHFDCGVFLNLTLDHMDYHGDMQCYKLAKEKLLLSSDFAFINASLEFRKNHINLVSFSSVDKKADVYVSSQKIFIKNTLKGSFQNDMLKGQHSQENIAAVTGVCVTLGVKASDICSAVSTFSNLEHRFEFVRKLDNATFINDSKATNIHSTLKAIEACDKQIILIAGGKYKGCDLSLLQEFREKIVKIILIGHDVDKMLPQLSDFDVVDANNLENAVLTAFEYSKSLEKDCAILLSPFCASFDQFKNFEERGKEFKTFVLNLA